MTEYPTRSTPRTIAATLIAATGLASLSPVQQAGLVAGAAFWSSSALAETQQNGNVPGVGVVVKKKPGNSNFAIPTGEGGSVTLSGLEPGAYELSLGDGGKLAIVEVPESGLLAFRAVEDKGRRWIEQIRAYPEKAIDLSTTFSQSPGQRCDPLPGRPSCSTPPTLNYIDVNRSSAEEIARLAPRTGKEAAAIVVAERRNGAFKNVTDFASRICSRASIDFGIAPAMFGETRIMGRKEFPDAKSFQCNAAPQARLRGGIVRGGAKRAEYAVLDWKCMWIEQVCMLV